MSIQLLDPQALDPADVAGCHAVRVAYATTDLPGEPVPPEADTRNFLTATWSEERQAVWVARTGGSVVGWCRLALPDVQNTRIGLLHGFVHPEHRRQGHGSALLAEATRLAREDGRETLIAESVEGMAGAAFLDRLGFVVAQREAVSTLRLAEVDPAWLAGVAAAEHPGYALRSWSGPVPAELLDRFAAGLNGMQDAPLGDLQLEAFQWNGKRVRDWEEFMAGLGRDLVTTVALHEPTGEVAGITMLLVPRTPNGRALQDDTTVVRAHRGHGLGLWIKAANARRLLAEHPEVDHIRTGNAADNEHMIRINTQLGFRLSRVTQERQAPVADLAKQLGI